MMQNNLFLRRLMVFTEDGKTAYDESFHLGVNIIRGHNSSGKSTIIRFIFLVLGGCYSEFTPEALRCRSVLAEVEINGHMLVLKRYLDKTSDGVRVDRYAPMYIYFGSIEECQADKRVQSAKFQKFNYKTTTERRSFSNILFGLMGLPKNEMQDTSFFIDSLTRKRDAIEHSIHTRDYFDLHHLDFCPECLTRLDTPVEEGHCPLCKSPIDNSRGKTQATRIRLELDFQIRQAESVQKNNERELEEKQAQLRSMKRKLTSSQKQYDSAVSNVRSTQEEQIDELIQTKGYKEGEIAQFNTLLEYAEKYERLKERLNSLNGHLSEVTRYIKAEEKRIEREQQRINHAISENGLFLLNNDDVRQDEFVNANDFKIDYKQNQAYISNQRYKLSASSAFYLKMAARFALFFASLQVDSMLYPRFMISDNMEDKGMEENRAKNFQRIIMQRLKQMPPCNYQLIFATSNIAEELDTPEYTIGDKYTPDCKSLKNV